MKKLKIGNSWCKIYTMNDLDNELFYLRIYGINIPEIVTMYAEAWIKHGEPVRLSVSESNKGSRNVYLRKISDGKLIRRATIKEVN